MGVPHSTTPENGMQRLRRNWFSLVVSVLARGTLVMFASLVTWAALPVAWGWIPTTVVSDSMAPGIRAGDVVVAMPVHVHTVQQGQVLLVDDPSHPGRLRLHRLVDFQEGNLILRGDANEQNDSEPIEPSAVRGVGVLRVPWVGLPTVWLRHGDLVPLGVTIASVALLLAASAFHRDRPKPRGRRKRVAVAGAAAAGMLLLGSGGLAPPDARAAFSHSTGNPSSSLSANSNYPCLTTPVLSSPYLLYRFTEASGTSTLDSSGNNRTGTIQPTSTRVPGACVPAASPALELAVGGYVSTPGSAISSPATLTVQVWFKTTTTSGGRLIGFGSNQTGTSARVDRHVYLTNSGAIVFGVDYSGRDTISSATGYNDGQWHLATATLTYLWFFSYITLSIDDENVDSTLIGVPPNYNGYWRVGNDTLSGWPSPPASSSFEGTVDSAAVYTSALSAAEISAIYAAGR